MSQDVGNAKNVDGLERRLDNSTEDRTTGLLNVMQPPAHTCWQKGGGV